MTVRTCDEASGRDIAAAGNQIGATVQPSLNEGVWLATTTGGTGSGTSRGATGPGLGLVRKDDAFGDPVASF